MKKGLLTLTLAVSSILIGGIIAIATTSAFAANVSGEAGSGSAGDTEVSTDTAAAVTTADTAEPMHLLRVQMRTEVEQRTAEKLGVTVEQLNTARTEAADEILAEHGIDPAAHKALMLAQAKERLQLLVNEGVITQEQMDARLQQIEANNTFELRDGPGHGHHGTIGLDF